MKFFLKRELIWVPIMGIAWWALDFPFLRRHSFEFLKKNPAQKGKDFAATLKACEKFSHTPTSVMNFLEVLVFPAPSKRNSNHLINICSSPKREA